MPENVNNEDKLIGTSDIARLAHVKPAAVSNWKRRKGDFPQPKAGENTKRPLFSQKEVEDWLTKEGIFSGAKTSDSYGNRSLQNEIQDYLRIELSKSSNTATESILLLAWWYSRNLEDGKIQEARQNLNKKYSGDNSFDDTRSLTEYWETHPNVQQLAGLPDTAHELADILSTELQNLSQGIFGMTGTGPYSNNELISQCFAKVLSPHLEEKQDHVVIFDPCVGFGFDLLQVSKEWQNSTLIGQEIHSLTSDLTTFLFLLRGIPAEISTCDSLYENAAPNPFADIVVASPPLGGRLAPELRNNLEWPYGPPSRDQENAWIQIVLNALKPNGRAAILLRSGFLSSKTSLSLRRTLVQENLIDAVIGLPAGLLSGTGVKPCLVVLAKDRDSREHARAIGDIFVANQPDSVTKPERQQITISYFNNVFSNFSSWLTGKDNESQLWLEWAAKGELKDPYSTKISRTEGVESFFLDMAHEVGLEELTDEQFKVDQNIMLDIVNSNFLNLNQNLNQTILDSAPSRSPFQFKATNLNAIHEQGFNLTPQLYVNDELTETISLPELVTKSSHLEKTFNTNHKHLQESVSTFNSKISDFPSNFSMEEKTIGELVDEGVIELVRGVMGKAKHNFPEDHISDLVPVYQLKQFNELDPQTVGSSAGTLNQLNQADKYAKHTPRNIERIIKYGDVIFSNHKADHGDFLPKMVLEHSQFLLAQPLFAIRVTKEPILHSRDILRWGKSSNYQTEWDRYASGTTSMKRVTQEDFLRFKINYPSNTATRTYLETIEELKKKISDSSEILDHVIASYNQITEQLPSALKINEKN